MLVKFLPILLIIFQDVKSDSNDNDLTASFSYIDTCNYYNVNNNEELIIKFNKLKKYKTNVTRYENVEFNEVRIYYLHLEELKDNTSIPCGFIMSTITKDENHHASFSIAYNKGSKFGSAYTITPYCNIQMCELGLIFFDKNKNAGALNNINEIQKVDHTVLMVAKSTDNKMLLGVRQYHKVNIRLGLCPYINWVHKKGWIKLIPEDHIRNNGFFEEKNDYAHIIVPIYKKNYNTKEFICGKLIQPTLPDLLIGFKLKEDSSEKDIEGEINPLNEDIKCKSSDNPQYHYHFGYSETDTNYMSERIMESIKIRDKDSKHKFYAGQKIYIYKWDKIKDALENANSVLRLKDPTVTENVLCIKSLKSGIKANILPTIGSVDTIKKHQQKNIFYRLIKSDDLYKNYTFRCLSKVEGTNNGHMEEFYSRSAVFSIKNEEKPNIIYTLSNNEIKFERENMDNYGSYRCKESNATKAFNENVVTMNKVYYLPDEGSELTLDSSKNNNKQYIGCIKQYESLGEIKKIRMEFGENVRKPIDIDNFSNGTEKIVIKENLIIYKMPKGVPGVIVKCIYQTPADTTFYTKREISFVVKGGNKNKNVTIYATNSNKAVIHYENNLTVWIAAIVITVILLCIMIIIVAHILVRGTTKRKVGKSWESSLSNSGSSSLSKNSNIDSSGLRGIKKTIKGQSNEDLNLIILKYGRSSKTSTSSNVTENSSSTNHAKNYFKNVKIVAK
uniref:EGF-like domain-containing protein n=1 Tax=Strongyloides venezuelensis TaxID=75913 RepID=A0A0K0EVS1_STRVS